MRLLRVELTRLRLRRAVILLLLGCFAIPALVWVGVAWNTRPVSAEEQAQVQAQVDRDRNHPRTQRIYERCLRDPQRFGVQAGDDVKAACDRSVLPQAEWYSSRSPLSLGAEIRSSGPAVLALLTVLLVLVGCTFAGHDWNSGSMSNQLLFEPRRLRVWVAKGLVVLLSGAVVGALVLAAYWGGLWILAATRDIDTAGRVLDLVSERSLRGLLLAAFAGLGAYALTMLFRSTVATLGVLFALAVVGPLLLTVLGFEGNQRWMPHHNFAAVVNDGVSYFDETVAQACGGMDQECGMVRLGLGGGVRYFGGLLALAIAPSLWSFRRRDVP